MPQPKRLDFMELTTGMRFLAPDKVTIKMMVLLTKNLRAMVVIGFVVVQVCSLLESAACRLLLLNQFLSLFLFLVNFLNS